MRTTYQRSTPLRLARRPVIALFLLALFFYFSRDIQAAQTSIIFTGVQTQVTVSSGLNAPSGITVNSDGTLYIADTNNNRIIRLTSAGSTSVLGTGTLNAPSAVAVDTAKNLYIADTGNSRILKVSANGSVTTVNTATLGTPLSAPSGLATDAAGNLYIADTNNNRIVQVTAAGTAQLFSTGSLSLNHPQGIAIDSVGNLFIADTNNGRIVEVTSSGNAQQVNPDGLTLTHPIGIGIDKQGNLFVSDASTSQVMELSYTGDGYVLGASGLDLSGPSNLAVDASGDLYIADTNNNRLVQLQLNAVDIGAIPIGQTVNVVLNYTVKNAATLGSIEVLTTGAAAGDFANTGGGTCQASHAYNANDTCTVTLSFSPAVAGARSGAVVLADPTGGVLEEAFLHGIGQGPQLAFSSSAAAALSFGPLVLNMPVATITDGVGNLYVADSANNRVLKLTPQGSSSVLNTGNITPGQVAGIAMDAAGNLYLADETNQRIVEVTPQGTASTLNFTASGISFPNPLTPHGLAASGSGALYIADTANNRILHRTLDGVVNIVNTGTMAPATPYGIAVDGPGNLYIADSGNNRILKVAPGGVTSVVSTGTTTLQAPQGLALDPSGSLYIADSNNNRIVKVTPQGSISTLDTGMALSSPAGVDIDSAGNLYIADSANNRILKLDRADAPSLQFLSANIGVTSSDSPQTTSVENIGNQALTFSAITLDAGDNHFSIASSGNNVCTATTSLSPGVDCNIFTSFTPAATGQLSGAVTLTDNAQNAPAAQQQIQLAGTGLDVESAFNISGPAAVYVGSAGNTYTVTALDAANATDVGFNGTLTVSITGASTASTSVTLTNGAGTFSLPMLSVTGTYTLTVTSPHATGSTMITAQIAPENLTWSTPASITYGTALSSAQLNATVTGNGGAAIAGTYTYTPASGTVLDAGTQTLNVTFTPNDSAQYSVKSGSVTLTVNQALTTLTLATSAASVTSGTSVTFTATVSATAGTPAGSVNFLDGSTLLGTSALNAQGVASFSTNALTVGVHAITASYGGDTNYAVSSSAALSQTVAAATPPDYSVTINPTSLSVKQGSSGTASITITPVGAFTGAFSFACSGLPANSRCGFQPTSANADGSNSPVTVAMSITTDTTSASLALPATPFAPGNMPLVAVALFWLPGSFLGGFLTLRRHQLTTHGKHLLLLLVLMLLVGGLSACGGSSSGGTSTPTTPVGTSTVTVTVASGASANHTASLTVVVTQ